MHTFYETNFSSTKATTIVPGSYFSIRLEDKWFRVKCEEYDSKTEKAQIFFIDNGKRNTCHANLLHRLDNQFNNLPAQVLNCRFLNLMRKLYVLKSFFRSWELISLIFVGCESFFVRFGRIWRLQRSSESCSGFPSRKRSLHSNTKFWFWGWMQIRYILWHSRFRSPQSE